MTVMIQECATTADPSPIPGPHNKVGFPKHHPKGFLTLTGCVKQLLEEFNCMSKAPMGMIT